MCPSLKPNRRPKPHARSGVAVYWMIVPARTDGQSRTTCRNSSLRIRQPTENIVTDMKYGRIGLVAINGSATPGKICGQTYASPESMLSQTIR
jgi:hypothetical protein